MKYFIKYIWIFLIVVSAISSWFISCKNSKKEPFDSQIIKLIPTKLEQIKFSQIFSSVEIFIFGTNDEIIYVRPEKIIVKNNLFYLLASKMIIVWDEKGNLVLNISHIGNGPGDYIGIDDFQVEDNGNIIVNDNAGQKMIRYNSRGEYINTINHGLNARNFIKINEMLYINSGDLGGYQSEYKVHAWNETNKKIEKRYLKRGPEAKYFGVLEYTNFSYFNDTLSYSQSFSNTIYQLTDNNAIPRLFIDFGKHNLPKGYAEDFTDMSSFMQSFGNSGYASRIDGYREGNNYLFLAYSYKEKRPFLWLSKIENVIHHFNEFEDDFLFPSVIQNTGYHCLPIFIDEDDVYFSIDAYRFIELYDSIKKIDNQKLEYQILIKSIYDRINEDSNSLIIKYKIKK